jgi:hypothetical protein
MFNLSAKYQGANLIKISRFISFLDCKILILIAINRSNFVHIHHSLGYFGGMYDFFKTYFLLIIHMMTSIPIGSPLVEKFTLRLKKSTHFAGQLLRQLKVLLVSGNFHSRQLHHDLELQVLLLDHLANGVKFEPFRYPLISLGLHVLHYFS